MSLWQYHATVAGWNRANAPPGEGDKTAPPSIEQFQDALASSVMN